MIDPTIASQPILAEPFNNQDTIMSNKALKIDDASFIKQFEACNLAPSHFNHEGHLRLAWLYLNHYDFKEASQKISLGIQCYATSLGATDKFHTTLTDAFTRLIHRQMQINPTDSWQSFLKQNPNLINKPRTLLHQYYSEELLNQPSTKHRIAEPDLRLL